MHHSSGEGIKHWIKFILNIVKWWMWFKLNNDWDCVSLLHFRNEEVSPQEDRKYLVFEKNLMELFQFCPSRHCGAPCNVSRSTAKCHGSMLVVTQECTLCDYTRRWSSQPMIGNIPAGNLLISSAALFSSACPTKVLRFLQHLNVQGVSMNTFLNHQRFYLQPAIVDQWRTEQMKLIQQLREKGEPLILGGDARCDSPGHSAKYGTYTLMDLMSGQVIDIQLIQVKYVCEFLHCNCRVWTYHCRRSVHSA